MTETYVVRREDTGSQLIDGELLVINFETSFYYGLNGTATAVWNLLAAPRTLEAVASRIATASGAPPETVAADVDELVGRMVKEGLVEAGTADPVPADDVRIDMAAGYASPTLERYERLERLILSGE